MSLISKSPYYDDYDSSKQYTQILAKPGAVEQAREFTQVQTMIFDFLKKLSDTLLKDGNIVSGMSFKQDGNNVTVLDGRVYIDGKIHEFKEQSVSITGSGTDVVGVKLVESIVTSNEDASLLDPATDMGNYGMPGADRIKSVPILTINDEDSNELYVFEDGELKIAVAVPELDSITDVLAKRTYDESGNYRVRGLELDVEPYDASHVQAIVNVGTAYIMGYDVTKPYPVKRVIPMSKTTTKIKNEPKTYSSSIMNYPLNNYPASSIDRVSASVQVTETKTRSNTGDIDYLNNGSVVKIDSVYSGDTVYTQGVNYQLTSDGVEWISTTRPANGNSYNVTYTYLKTMEEGVDYAFLQEETDAWGSTKDYIQILSGGSKPTDKSIFYVDYSHYLARIDAITLDKDGNIVVVEGQPAVQRNVREPIVLNEDLLLLGYICLPPNSGNGKAVNKVVTRTDMKTIQKMGERLSDVEYNLALTQLDIEAITGESPAELQGVFTDGFYTTTKGDLTHPLFSAMYSLEDAMILIPYTNISVENANINIGASNIGDSFGRVVTAPFQEVVGINQQYATTTMLINPYLAFNTLAVMKVIPEVDNWIEDETIELEKYTVSTRTFNRWWGHTDIGYKLDDDLKDATLDRDGSRLEDFRGWDEHLVVNATNYSTEIKEEAITYMRQNEVEIQVANLTPNADNLKCTFDGVKVKLTPISGYGTTGSQSGTCRANGNGVLHATFTIPHGIKTGTREIVLSNDNTSCSGSYTSIGTKRTTINTVLHQHITLNAIDPLAQTFSFPEDTIVTSVGLYFAGDASSTENVIVQIRNTQNGYPSNTIYEEKVLTPSQIRVSSTANLETKVTFDDPVYCKANEQYSICVETDSASHSLYICELGGTDISTGTKVTRQPYLAGMLFSSSNGLAWTAHQGSNMKFKVYNAVFEEEGTIEFDALTNVPLDTLLVLADYLTPAQTGCIWEFATSKSGTYIPLTAYSELELDNVINTVYLRATFKSNTNISPIMATDNFTFVGFLQDVQGTYISKNVSLSDYYTKVKITYDAYEPIGSSVKASIAYDTDGNTWVTSPTSDETTSLQDGWVTHEVVFDISQSLQADQFRVRLDLTASNSMVLRPKARRLTVVLN